MGKKIKRLIAGGLFFEYEVSPHRVFLAKNAETTRGVVSPPSTALGKVGEFVPFKQARLKGYTNPLRPPLHLETVLIGRALGQHTGYLSGVGFRVRDDGCVEAEFAEGHQEFESMKEFETEVFRRAGSPYDETEA